MTPDLTFTQYEEFFRTLTLSRNAYPYQTTLFTDLREQKNIVLRAPTGAGKTWALVAPFLYDWFHSSPGRRWADRMIYALPLRSLATGLHATVDEGARRTAETLGTGAPRIALQIGGQQDDPYFEADLVFTTIDQLLSGYILNPVSVGERAANIPAGAIPGSIVVVDEIHLLEPARSMGTLLEMTQRLKGLIQTVLMSATIPDAVGEHLAAASQSRWMSLARGEVLALPSHRDRRRSLNWVGRPLTAEDVLREHSQSGRTAVVVNSVAKAQRLYREIRLLLEGDAASPDLILLHARFFPEDRKKQEEKLRLRMGPDAKEANVILISTQVVEAGLDFSADVLLTELAPMNALIQRAGRVARYPGRNEGRVLVFALEANENGQPRLGPYRSEAGFIAATQSLLCSIEETVELDFQQEIEWLNAVHQKADLEEISHCDLRVRRDRVATAMNGEDPAARANLIRDTDSVAVIIAAQPEALRFRQGHWPRFLSVPRASLWTLEKSFRETSKPAWVIKSAWPLEGTDSERDETFRWEICNSMKAVGWLAAIHPDFAAYSSEIGLELGVASTGETELPVASETARRQRYGYQRESWGDHARAVAEIAAGLLEALPVLRDRIRRTFPAVDLDRIVRLTALLHDTGKLSEEWQWQARQWELARTGETVTEPLAHTTYDPETDWNHPARPRFPPHAMEGAYAICPWVFENFSDSEQARIVITATGRHHAPFARALGDFRLTAEAGQELGTLFGSTTECADVPDLVTRGQFSSYMMTPTEWEMVPLWPVYLVVVRLLRLADQKAMARHSSAAVHS